MSAILLFLHHETDVMIDPDLLALLRCPETMQPLRVATPEELARVNLQAGLMREDGLAAAVVTRLGVRPDAVRRAVLDLGRAA